MKQSDIFSVIIVATVGMLASYFGLKTLLGNPDDQHVQYKTVEAVSAELSTPNEEMFNPEAINPTVEVYIGGCKDTDQNGILDKAELIACGQYVSTEKKDDQKEEEKKDEKKEEPGSKKEENRSSGGN